MSLKYQHISKEKVPALHFLNEDVLLSEYERTQRKLSLERAVILGNVFKNKVKIFFEAFEGPKEVETTIWSCKEEIIFLKENIGIPIRSIKKIEVD